MLLWTVASLLVAVVARANDLARDLQQGGLTDPSLPDPAIIQGVKVNITDYPYQTAYLHEWDQWCGGVIVSERVVITAQHCVRAFAENMRTGSMGVGHNVYFDMFQAPDSLYGIELTASFPLYGDDYGGKDFSFVYLKRPIQFRAGVQPVAMASLADIAAGRLAPGTTAKISGWGSITRPPAVAYPDDLYATVVRISADKKIGPITLSPDQLPVRSFAPLLNADTCYGDSGGPLVVPGPGNTQIVAGLTSWGNGCGDARFSASYAHVAMFNEWTKRMVGIIEKPTARVYKFQVGNVRLPPKRNATGEIVVPMGLKKMVIRLETPPNPVALGAVSAYLIRGTGEDPVALNDCRLNRTECTITAPLFGLYRLVVDSGLNVLMAPLVVEYHSFDPAPLPMRPLVSFDLPANSYTVFGNIMAIPGTSFNASVTSANMINLGIFYNETLDYFRPAQDTPLEELVTSVQKTVGSFGSVSVGVVNAAATSKPVQLALSWLTASRQYAGYAVAVLGTEGKPVRSAKVYKVVADLVPGSEVAIEFIGLPGGVATFRPRVRFSLYNNPASVFADEWSCRANSAALVICSGIVPGFAKSMSISIPALPRPTVYDILVYYTAVVQPAAPRGDGTDESGSYGPIIRTFPLP